GISSTTARVTPPNRYAVGSDRAIAHAGPRMNMLAPKANRLGPSRLATIAATMAPSAVPTRSCQDTMSAALSEDWATTRVAIGAQWASGSRNSRATSSDATAVTAVRPERTTTGHTTGLTRS